MGPCIAEGECWKPLSDHPWSLFSPSPFSALCSHNKTEKATRKSLPFYLWYYTKNTQSLIKSVRWLYIGWWSAGMIYWSKTSVWCRFWFDNLKDLHFKMLTFGIIQPHNTVPTRCPEQIKRLKEIITICISVSIKHQRAIEQHYFSKSL